MLRFSTSGKAPSSRSELPNNEGFLKLKYNVTIKDWKINVEIVLFSKNNSNRSAFNLPGKLIDKLMEYTALDWVENYAVKNLGKLRDTKEFIKNINDNGGVKKSELINLFTEANLKGIIVPFHSYPEKLKLPSLNNLEVAIIENFNNATGSEQFDDKAIRSYVNYMDPEEHQVNAENFISLNNFVLAFQKLANKNPSSPLVIKNIGRVKFLKNSLKLFKGETYSKNLRDAGQRIKKIIVEKMKSQEIDFDTENLLKEFFEYLKKGVDAHNPKHLSSLINIANSKDVLTLIGLKLGQDDIKILQKDIQVIIAELNKDLIASENLPDIKYFLNKINVSRLDIRFDDSNNRVEELWTSEFIQYCSKGDVAIDDDSFIGLKNLSEYALQNFGLFRSTLSPLDDYCLSMISIYLKKLAADLIIFENDLQEIEI